MERSGTGAALSAALETAARRSLSSLRPNKGFISAPSASSRRAREPTSAPAADATPRRVARRPAYGAAITTSSRGEAGAAGGGGVPGAFPRGFAARFRCMAIALSFAQSDRLPYQTFNYKLRRKRRAAWSRAAANCSLATPTRLPQPRTLHRKAVLPAATLCSLPQPDLV